jgi:SOS-response transcriptional repressor LexA
MGKRDQYDIETREGRLKAARVRRGYATAKAAANAMGMPYGTYSGYEGATRWFQDDAELERVARFFRTPVEWIAFGRGAPQANNIVAVLGKISAGGQVEVNAEQLSEADPLFEIELERPVSPNSFALQVTGDSMYPRYEDGDVVVCSREGREPSALVGREAVVISADHNRYLKVIAEQTQSGLYTLESFNARPMRAVPLIWASEVTDVIRAARFRTLNNGNNNHRSKVPAR